MLSILTVRKTLRRWSKTSGRVGDQTAPKRADANDASALAALSRLLTKRQQHPGYAATFQTRVAEHNYFFPSLSMGAHQNAAGAQRLARVAHRVIVNGEADAPVVERELGEKVG